MRKRRGPLMPRKPKHPIRRVVAARLCSGLFVWRCARGMPPDVVIGSIVMCMV